MKLITRIGAAGLVASLAVGLATPVTAAAPSAGERRAAFHPTLKASSPTVVAGHRLILSGKVKPARKAEKVQLQKRVGAGKWRQEAVLKVRGNGAFVYRDKPKTPGLRHYRVVVAKNGAVKGAKSKAVAVTVYRWQSLTDVPTRRTSNTMTTKAVSINAHDRGPAYAGYAQSWAPNGYADWNLERQCLQVTGLVGNGDDSDDLATATIDLVADGGSLYSKSFGLASAETVKVDISDVFRLAFKWTSTNPEASADQQGGAQAVFAQPQILCAF